MRAFQFFFWKISECSLRRRTQASRTFLSNERRDSFGETVRRERWSIRAFVAYALRKASVFIVAPEAQQQKRGAAFVHAEWPRCNESPQRFLCTGSLSFKWLFKIRIRYRCLACTPSQPKLVSLIHAQESLAECQHSFQTSYSIMSPTTAFAVNSFSISCQPLAWKHAIWSRVVYVNILG